jgi:hypothetical protein
MKFKFIILIVTSLAGSSCFGQAITQQVINITGNSYQKDRFVVDWSVGELAIINEMKSANGSYLLTNGFIQTITDQPNFASLNTAFGKEEIQILPNPTRDILEIDFLTNQTGAVKFQLYDILGQLLVTREFYMYGYGQIQKIDMTTFKAGMYTLAIQLNLFRSSVLKSGSYKIVKI